MRKIIRGLSMFVLLSGLGACATITRGTNEQFTINSSPPDAQAHTSSGFNCESTPCTIRMPRKDGFTITVIKAGYKPVQMAVQTKLADTGAAGFVGNALIGGVVGAAVDIGTGATLDLTPNPLNVTLEPVEVAVATPPAALAAAPAAPPTSTPAPVATVAANTAVAAPAATASAPVPTKP